MPGGGGVGNGQLVFNRDRVSVLQGEEFWGPKGTLLSVLKMVKMASVYVLCISPQEKVQHLKSTFLV